MSNSSYAAYKYVFGRSVPEADKDVYKRQADTIAAVATAMTASGIGIIRISGPDSREIAGKISVSYTHLILFRLKPD